MITISNFLRSLGALTLTLAATATLPSPARAADGLPNPFFAMDTGTRDATHTNVESQVRMVADLGFAGFGPIYLGPDMLRETLAQLDKYKLKLFALYVGINIDSGKEAVTPRFKEAIELLKGRDTFLWVYVESSKFAPSSDLGDGPGVEALQELATLAEKNNVRIALYPHAGVLVQRVEDAARMARKVNRPNLGVTFNLCHWLQVDGKDLNASLEAARPFLFVVTINGADKDAKGWDRLIQPLDKGSYDVAPLLQTLKKMGYTGPIGLQHYGIQGSAEENLTHSMNAWKKLSAKAAQSAPSNKE
jgi:sugar phosphate isomerase/epimerase